MKSSLQRYRALETALAKLKAASERDVGRAVLQRQNLLEQRAAIEETMLKHKLLGDLMLESGIRQIARVTADLQTSDATIASLRRKATNLILKAKRASALATQARREAELRMARIELAELTDQAAGRSASLPQAKLY